ncbi:MAG TPA: DUF6798 domain-containing protein [Isosphaeraceae bacterium]|nr:DUF6798 domain-containing protein [Isosphaeraceae bacterium]
MLRGDDSAPVAARPWRRWVVDALILGLYLTLRGYHSFDGDQAYRLPLLLRRQDPSLYAGDPFVEALEAFNPHRGWLIVMDAVTRPLGLAPGLFVLFVLTFLVTCRAVDRLARAVWPEFAGRVGWVAVGLILAAKAGNIGTHHLFEAMVLDRLFASALGWQALAEVVWNPGKELWRPAVILGLATWVHPSMGLQLAMVLGSSWVIWSIVDQPKAGRPGKAMLSLAWLALAVLPGLAINLPRGATLLGSLSHEEFWLLSVELQNPQHMLPHLWRMPQWLSWTCYVVLAALQLAGWGLGHVSRTSRAAGAAAGAEETSPTWPPARRRLAIVLAIILAGLGVAWFAIEVLHQVQVTIVQPFRMATLARGIALILIAGRLVALCRSGGLMGWWRATLLAMGFLGDWRLVIVTIAELSISALQAIRLARAGRAWPRGLEVAVFWGVLAVGLNFLGHHDTESGHLPLLVALGIGLLLGFWSRQPRRERSVRVGGRLGASLGVPAALAAAWLVPLGALGAAAMPGDHPAARHVLVRSLVDRCRLAAVPLDDLERLALWCRAHTPTTARFIGPPGPKTFRLWSRRSLAFNRAASPYHAAGLVDWFHRFQEHVDFHGSPAEFVRAYLVDRHRFEARYQALSDDQRAAMALRQGAAYVVADAPVVHDGPANSAGSVGPLELLHVEGRYAVYRVRAVELVQRHR